MQKKSYTVNFGNAVTVFPKKAAKKIINGEATLSDIRVLCALLSAGEGKISDAKLCAQTGLDEDEVGSALSYWRGVGVILADSTEMQSEKPDIKTEEPRAQQKSEPEKKVLLSKDMPRYTGIEISAMLESDGGKLREMIDVCQQLIGHIFTPNETNTLLGLCDWLGLDVDYVVTLVAYYVGKKPGCNVRYIEKAAVDLVNDGITDLDSLDVYIKNMELYDGVAGKLRTLIGIGGRAFTKKENNMISRWAQELGYGYDVIELAYEVCCDNKTTFSFDYANKVLENWYTSGVKTAEDAKEEIKRRKSAEKVNDSGIIKSFDSAEFFDAALKRTYKNMSKKS